MHQLKGYTLNKVRLIINNQYTSCFKKKHYDFSRNYQKYSIYMKAKYN